MRVGIVTVGDELLVGDTVNTNASWLGQQLDERGVTVERIVVVPDRTSDVAQVINEYRAAYDTVIVTGGLGPTHDDMTMDAVAAAVGRSVVEHPDAVAWLRTEEGYTADDLATGTTHLPEGSRLLKNPEGVAPGCVVENVYVLPGVPAEMKAMFETVADEFTGEREHVETVHVDEPESELVGRFELLRDGFDVSVGSYPGDHVRVTLRSTDPEAARDAATWLRNRVTLADADSDVDADTATGE